MIYLKLDKNKRNFTERRAFFKVYFCCCARNVLENSLPRNENILISFLELTTQQQISFQTVGCTRWITDKCHLI